MGPTYKQPGSYFSKFKWSKNCPIFEIDPTTARAEPKNANKDPFFFNLPSFTPPVRATVGEVRYSIEIDVGGGVGEGHWVNKIHFFEI